MRLRDLKPVKWYMTKSRYIMETICATSCGTKLEQDKTKMKSSLSPTLQNLGSMGGWMLRAQSCPHYWFKYYLIFKHL